MNPDPVSVCSPNDSAPLLRSRDAWILLIGWLLLAGPLFIGMPLNSDTALYDVQARTVLSGGVAYRDVVEPNLPGALWIHLGLRSVLGWSSESMRLADLVCFAGILWLWSAAISLKNSTRAAFLLAGSFFYLTRNEWCHAQRDVWMLLPAGAAMLLRLRRSPQSSVVSFVAEGVCWGAAFWIKPHVIIPAAGVAVADSSGRSVRMLIRDIGLVVAGGILAAIPGVVWLLVSGTWQPFLEMMLEWNPEYVAAGRARMSLDRWVLMSRRFAPWLWIHLVAVPIAVGALVHSFRNRTDSVSRSQRLLAGCYLSWLLQSFVLQHALDYIHVPGLLLGLMVVCRHPWQLPLTVRRSVVTAFVALAVLSTPFFRIDALRYWPVVVTHGSTPEVRTALAHGNLPDWKHLSEVIGFLNAQQVQDGDVTCMNVHSVHVYNETGTRPSTRFWSVLILQDLFPHRAAAISEVVSDSRHRFVVVEKTEASLMTTTPANLWMDSFASVFEAGSYRVLVRPDQVPRWLNSHAER